jgi:histidine ammonia-lyase
VARDDRPVELDAHARTRMEAARRVVERYVEEGLPAYGLTTGLGSRVVESLPADELRTYSQVTVLARAHSVGAPLPRDVVRAAMLVRASGLARGGAGARPEVAESLLALLNAGVVPVVPSTGSVGAADICMLAHVALVLLGEGRAEVGDDVLAGSEALASAGVEPLELAPKDGLAIISSNAVSIAWAALALVDVAALLRAVQASAALSMEAFRANLGPLDERVAGARPAPGQVECARELRALLAGGSLAESGGRRLQDPLSFRCASQVHGGLVAARSLLAAAVEPELTGAADNPLVLADDGEIVSTGNFFVSALALAADTVALALAQVASLSASRAARLLAAPLTGLPQNLAPSGGSKAGMAPLMKVPEALVAEIVHAAAPATLSAVNVHEGGVEDASTGAPLATARLATLLDRCRLLVALELVVAAHAVDLAQVEALGTGTAALHAGLRELAGPFEVDRPLGDDVERVAAGLDQITAAVRAVL